MIRCIACGALLVLGFVVPWWLFLVGAALYAFSFDAWELLFIGIFLDSLFGNKVPWLPMEMVYTLSLLGILCIAWGSKPFLRFYDREFV